MTTRVQKTQFNANEGLPKPGGTVFRPMNPPQRPPEIKYSKPKADLNNSNLKPPPPPKARPASPALNFNLGSTNNGASAGLSVIPNKRLTFASVDINPKYVIEFSYDILVPPSGQDQTQQNSRPLINIWGNRNWKRRMLPPDKEDIINRLSKHPIAREGNLAIVVRKRLPDDFFVGEAVLTRGWEIVIRGDVEPGTGNKANDVVDNGMVGGFIEFRKDI